MSEDNFDERQKRYLHYLETKGMNEEWIETCYGELRIAIEALADYADIIRQKVKEMQGYEQAVWEDRMRKIRRLQYKLENSIGYNRDEQLIKCQEKRTTKQDDVGGDALELAFRRTMKDEVKGDKRAGKDKKNC